MRKSVKSLQLILNELSHQLSIPSISHSAFSQRRAQLKHTAFIELNQKAVVDVQYGDGNFKRYKGMRVLGIDGSKILLPDTADIINTFGSIRYSNDHPIMWELIKKFFSWFWSGVVWVWEKIIVSYPLPGWLIAIIGSFALIGFICFYQFIFPHFLNLRKCKVLTDSLHRTQVIV